jgi:hypothetical protein
MLDLLYETALKRKDKLSQKAGRIQHCQMDVSNHWIDHQITETPTTPKIAAGDGSINRIKYLPFILYAIGVEAIITGEDSLIRVADSEIDIIDHDKHAEDRLRNRMATMEIANTLTIIEAHEPDYFLFDGSIFGDIIRPVPDPKSIIQSQYIEELSLISILMGHRSKIVAISKTSTSTEYFNERIPDMALFDLHSRKQGFSKPRYISLRDVKRSFPVNDNFLKSLDFTIFYARLDDYKNLLKFELPYKAGVDDIKRVLSCVKCVSAEGYPVLLRLAHDEVVIRKGDIEQISGMVGFLEKTGREML